jgi:4a-hydroxytetrahydrobiopterin dehydratase
MENLSEKKCVPCEGGVAPYPLEEAKKLMEKIPGWNLDEKKSEIFREYKFKNFYETMAFVNAVAYVANQEDHHPDLEVGYNYCKLHYHTHAIKGLSENDFICAAKINKL